MCLICADLNRGAMTFKEAKRNLSEMSSAIEPGHAAEVDRLIKDAEQEHYGDTDPEPFDPFWITFMD